MRNEVIRLEYKEQGKKDESGAGSHEERGKGVKEKDEEKQAQGQRQKDYYQHSNLAFPKVSDIY